MRRLLNVGNCLRRFSGHRYVHFSCLEPKQHDKRMLIVSRMILLSSVLFEYILFGTFVLQYINLVYNSLLDDGFLKVNSKPVCLQTVNDSPGNFTLPYTGTLVGVRLVHISGNVTHWSPTLRPGIWGTEGISPDLLEIFVTNSTKEVVTPPNGYPILSGTYKIDGVNNTYPQLTLPKFELLVSNGTVLSLWYGEDLFNYFEIDNRGTLCTDVYVLYQ